MARRLLFLVVAVLWAEPFAFGSVSGINFVYQPLTTMGTDAESGIIVTKVPIIASGPLENVLSYISAPHQLPQRGPDIIEDSNLLSQLGISVTGDEGSDSNHFIATLDLSQMKSTKPYELTDETVVKAALRCIRNTITEIGQRGIWKIKIVARQQDGAKWRKFETEYRPHPRR